MTREPRTQGEIDTAALARVGARPSLRPGRPAVGGMFDDPAYKALPAGEHGTARLAEDAAGQLNDFIEGRTAANKAALDEAEAEAARAIPGPIDTRRAISEIEGISRQTHGGQGPTDPAIATRMQEAARQLTSPGAGPTYPGAPVPPPQQAVPFDALRNVQKDLNNRVAMSENQADRIAAGASKQAAGVVADTMRNADPRLGPGNFGGALDRFGNEQRSLQSLTDNLYGTDTGLPADRPGRIAAGASRLGSAGRATETGGPHANEPRLRAIAQEEPRAASLIDQIRARNTADRLGIGIPTTHGGIGRAALRTVSDNLGNFATRARGTNSVIQTPTGPVDPVTYQLLHAFVQGEHRRTEGEQP